MSVYVPAVKRGYTAILPYDIRIFIGVLCNVKLMSGKTYFWAEMKLGWMINWFEQLNTFNSWLDLAKVIFSIDNIDKGEARLRMLILWREVVCGDEGS